MTVVLCAAVCVVGRQVALNPVSSLIISHSLALSLFPLYTHTHIPHTKQVGRGSTYEFELPLADSDDDSESEVDGDLFSETAR